MNLKDIKTTWLDHHDFAVWLVKRVRPKVTVDLGVFHGYSTFSFAEANIGQVYGIDSFQIKGSYETCLIYLDLLKKKNKCKNVKIVVGDFNAVYDTNIENSIDILHIDGTHTYDAVRNDFDKWSALVNDNGVILLHDVLNPAFDGPIRVVSEELNNYFVAVKENSNGLGVLTKNKELFNDLCGEFSLRKIIGMEFENDDGRSFIKFKEERWLKI